MVLISCQFYSMGRSSELLMALFESTSPSFSVKRCFLNRTIAPMGALLLHIPTPSSSRLDTTKQHARSLACRVCSSPSICASINSVLHLSQKPKPQPKFFISLLFFELFRLSPISFVLYYFRLFLPLFFLSSYFLLSFLCLLSLPIPSVFFHSAI